MKKPSGEQTIGLRDIVTIVLKRKWLVILPLIAVTGLAWGATYLLKPEYQSSAIIWIDQPSNVSRELRSIIGMERQGREYGEERRRRLQALQNEITSQTYLHQLIKELSLDNDPSVTRQAAKMREENPSYSLEQLKYNLLVDKLRDDIHVSFVGQDQIEIAVDAYDPVSYTHLTLPTN